MLVLCHEHELHRRRNQLSGVSLRPPLDDGLVADEAEREDHERLCRDEEDLVGVQGRVREHQLGHLRSDHVQYLMRGRQFDFVCLSPRTMHPHGAYV